MAVVVDIPVVGLVVSIFVFGRLLDAFAPGLSNGLLAFHPFAEKEDVGDDLGVGDSLKSGLGKTDGRQKIGFLGDQVSHSGRFGVHRVVARDEGHDAAGTDLVEGLQKEVVMDVDVEFVVGGIMDLVIPEGDIRNDEIEEVVRKLRGLVAHHPNIGILVELFGDAAGDGIEFHSGESGCQGFWKESIEDACPHGGLKDTASLYAHLLESVPHETDDFGRGIVGVRCACPGGLVFLVGQEFGEPFGVFLPFPFIPVEDLRDTTPAGIFCKDGLFFGCGEAAFFLDLLQKLDGGDIVSRLGLLAAFG